MYHVTTPNNLNSILSEGLKRRSFAVYLSKAPFSWWKPGMIILKVDVSGLENKITYVDESLDEFLLWSDIESSRITLYEASRQEIKQATQNYCQLLIAQGYQLDASTKFAQ